MSKQKSSVRSNASRFGDAIGSDLVGRILQCYAAPIELVVKRAVSKTWYLAGMQVLQMRDTIDIGQQAQVTEEARGKVVELHNKCLALGMLLPTDVTMTKNGEEFATARAVHAFHKRHLMTMRPALEDARNGPSILQSMQLVKPHMLEMSVAPKTVPLYLDHLVADKKNADVAVCERDGPCIIVGSHSGRLSKMVEVGERPIENAVLGMESGCVHALCTVGTKYCAASYKDDEDNDLVSLFDLRTLDLVCNLPCLQHGTVGTNLAASKDGTQLVVSTSNGFTAYTIGEFGKKGWIRVSGAASMRFHDDLLAAGQTRLVMGAKHRRELVCFHQHRYLEEPTLLGYTDRLVKGGLTWHQTPDSGPECATFLENDDYLGVIWRGLNVLHIVRVTDNCLVRRINLMNDLTPQKMIAEKHFIWVLEGPQRKPYSSAMCVPHRLHF